MSKKLAAFILLLVSFSFAYSLFVKVVVTQDTIATLTNVSIIQDGVELYAQKTDLNGMAAFNLTGGDYFVALPKSSIYPFQLSLVELRNNTNITLVKRQQISYPVIYGKITGPSSFANASVSVFSNGKAVVRTDKISPYGYYVLPLYSAPEGSYEITYAAPGFENKALQTYLQVGEYTALDIALLKAGEEKKETAPAILSASPQVSQYSAITISLSQGGSPIPGAKIFAITPSGNVSLTTDSSGKATINAARGGTYTFTYGAISTSTAVISKEPAVVTEETTKQETVPEVQETPSQGQQATSGTGNSQFLASAFVLAIAVLFVGFGILFALLFFLKKPKKSESGGKQEAHPHGKHKK